MTTPEGHPPAEHNPHAAASYPTSSLQVVFQPAEPAKEETPSPEPTAEVGTDSSANSSPDEKSSENSGSETPSPAPKTELPSKPEERMESSTVLSASGSGTEASKTLSPDAANAPALSDVTPPQANPGVV